MDLIVSREYNERMIERLTLREVSRKADEIVSRMESEFGTPDLVVAVANGGLYLGDHIARATNSRLRWVSIGKDLDLESLYENKLIPHQLARAIHGVRFLVREPSVQRMDDMPDDAKLVLLVDDTVHTGRTLELAYQAIKGKLPNALIVTAAVNSVRGKGADIVLHDQKRLWFPWSKNSEEYEAYRLELRARGLADVKE